MNVKMSVLPMYNGGFRITENWITIFNMLLADGKLSTLNWGTSSLAKQW